MIEETTYGDRLTELFNVLRQELVGIRDAVVEVADLVVREALEVLLVEVLGQARSEAECHLLEAVLEEAVDARDRQHGDEELEDALGELLGIATDDDTLDCGRVLDHPQVTEGASHQHGSYQHDVAHLCACVCVDRFQSIPYNAISTR